MVRKNIGTAVALIAMILAILIFAIVEAAPTADNFGAGNASGCEGDYVLVPVEITNAQNGPIKAVIFNIYYNKSVIDIADDGVQPGNLTSYWGAPAFNGNFSWGARIAMVYNATNGQTIQNGANGSVAVINFSVVGMSGMTSNIGFVENLDALQFSDAEYQIGTALIKNGTFVVGQAVMCGDVNVDGFVDSGDATLILYHSIYGIPLDCPWAGDVNCDGYIDSGDYTLIYYYNMYGIPLNCCAA